MRAFLINTHQMNPFILHILAITALDVLGSLSAKMWSIHKDPLYLLGTFLLFGGAGFIFAHSLRYEGMAIANVLWIALSIIIITAIGYFFFKEEISALQGAGILIITIGLIMINMK